MKEKYNFFLNLSRLYYFRGKYKNCYFNKLVFEGKNKNFLVLKNYFSNKYKKPFEKVLEKSIFEEKRKEIFQESVKKSNIRNNKNKKF